MTLGGDTMYLTSPRFGKEKMPVSVILNFISKAHKLGYHIKLTRKSRRDRVNLVFTPTEYDFSAYKSPWVLDRIGEYAIGMIADAVDEVDLQGMEINRFDYPSQRKTKRKPRVIRNKSNISRRKRTIEEVYKSLTYPATINETLLEEIADVEGLSPYTKRRFVQFGLLFWGGKRADPTYILEWARRFGRGSEYSIADDVRLGYLKEVDGVERARGRLFEVFVGRGSNYDAAERSVMKHYPKARRVKRRKTTNRTTRKPKRINMRHRTKNN